MVHAERFAEALEPHYNDALRYCRALCARRTPTEAEDVLQQALLKALEGYGGLRDPSRFRTWLFQIITRTFYSEVRRTFWKRLVPLTQAPEVAAMPAVYHRPEQFDDRHRLRHALARLPDKQRSAILLFELGGFSLEEIAKMQGDRSVSATKSRLSRGRARLQQYLLEAEANTPSAKAAAHPPNPSTDLDHETLHLLAALDRKVG